MIGFREVPPIVVNPTNNSLDPALIIVIITTFFTGLTTAAVTIIAAFRGNSERKDLRKEVVAVHDEVRTMNGLTVGELAGRGETRRIEVIPKDDRTAQEDAHMVASETNRQPIKDEENE